MDYVKIAKQRSKNLKKRGIDNNALKAYEMMLEVARQSSPAVMKRQEKKIAKQFVNNELSTVTGIKKKYKRVMGKRADDVVVASEVVDVTVQMNDDTLRYNLGSDVLKGVFQNQEAVGYTTKMARNALSRYAEEHLGEKPEEDKMIDDITADIRKRMKKRGML